MAQTRVSEFFPSKKKTRHSNATKKRKLDALTTEDAFTVGSNSLFQTSDLTENKPLVVPIVKIKTKTKTKGSKTIKAASQTAPGDKKSSRSTKSRKKLEVADQQTKLTDIFKPNINEFRNASFDFEPCPSVEDEGTSASQDGGTPTKQIKLASKFVNQRSHKDVQNVNEITPLKNSSSDLLVLSTPAARKRLQLTKDTIPVVAENTVQYKSVAKKNLKNKELEEVVRIVESMKVPGKVISPLPQSPVTTSSNARTPATPTSPNVKAAIEKCKQLLNSGESAAIREKQVKKEIRARLKKCGKLEEISSQLSALNKSLKLAKKAEPKLKPFTSIEIQEQVPAASPGKTASPFKSDVKVPAYEKYHSLAAPPPPTLALPYKYKLLVEMFRGMDTAVSMMHNRSEICTFSKLKVAVQTMTKRNFEKKNIGQIKSVYPTAYVFRQERVPMFGQKVSDYQLSVEADLGNKDSNSTGNLNPKLVKTFGVRQLLERRQVFNTNLIYIVKEHHKSFLSGLDTPLRIPDNKITRWHPKFPLDELPDIMISGLPEPPDVPKFHTAKDVLEQSRGKLPAKVEQALANVARQSSSAVKNESKPNVPPTSIAPSLKGVPLSLLEKIRAKEAKKLAESLTRTPEEDKRKAMMSRLPDMMRIIRSYFITEKKPSILIDIMVQTLLDSSKACISKSDVEGDVKMLLELTPEWMTMVQVKKRRYLKIDRNIDIQSLSKKILQHN